MRNSRLTYLQASGLVGNDAQVADMNKAFKDAAIRFRNQDNEDSAVSINGGRGRVSAEAVKDIHYSKSDVVSVIIVFDFKSLGVIDAAALARESGEKASSETLKAHRVMLAGLQEQIVEQIGGQLSMELKITGHLTLLLNAVTANVEYDKISDIERFPYVAGVYLDEEFDADEFGLRDGVVTEDLEE